MDHVDHAPVPDSNSIIRRVLQPFRPERTRFLFQERQAADDPRVIGLADIIELTIRLLGELDLPAQRLLARWSRKETPEFGCFLNSRIASSAARMSSRSSS